MAADLEELVRGVKLAQRKKTGKDIKTTAQRFLARSRGAPEEVVQDEYRYGGMTPEEVAAYNKNIYASFDKLTELEKEYGKQSINVFKERMTLERKILEEAVKNVMNMEDNLTGFKKEQMKQKRMQMQGLVDDMNKTLELSDKQTEATKKSDVAIGKKARALLQNVRDAKGATPTAIMKAMGELETDEEIDVFNAAVDDAFDTTYQGKIPAETWGAFKDDLAKQTTQLKEKRPSASETEGTGRDEWSAEDEAALAYYTRPGGMENYHDEIMEKIDEASAVAGMEVLPSVQNLANAWSGGKTRSIEEAIAMKMEGAPDVQGMMDKAAQDKLTLLDRMQDPNPPSEIKLAYNALTGNASFGNIRQMLGTPGNPASDLETIRFLKKRVTMKGTRQGFPVPAETAVAQTQKMDDIMAKGIRPEVVARADARPALDHTTSRPSTSYRSRAAQLLSLTSDPQASEGDDEGVAT
tara:strand:- start:1455 stop:2855 length:1401 start_codon:yes stop_codon:yes gene_type:complete